MRRPEEEQRARRGVRLHDVQNLLLEEAVLIATVPRISFGPGPALSGVDGAVRLAVPARVIEAAGRALYAPCPWLFHPQVDDGQTRPLPQAALVLAAGGAVAWVVVFGRL